MNITFIANLLNGFGVALLLIGHWQISKNYFKKGFYSSFLGAIIVSIGSILLQSWPVAGLNLLWAVISFYGATIGFEHTKYKLRKIFILELLSAVLVLGILANVFGYPDISAWCTTIIYIMSFFLFTHNNINKTEYMFWSFIGFFLIIEHLIHKQSYSVLVNEIIGGYISLKTLLKDISIDYPND